MTILIDDIKPNLLKTISKIAKNENIMEKKALNEIIEKGIKTKTKNKVPDHLIANKDTYNPNPERRMKFAGIFKTEAPFDVDKAIKEIRTRKY